MKLRALTAVLLASAALAACQPRSEAPAETASYAERAAGSAAEGVVRYSVGEARVTALADGTGQLNTALFKGIEAAEAEHLLRAGGDEPPPDAYVNAFLVDTGGRRVLIDTGAGASFGPGAGKLFERLQAAGVDPASVNAVVISHMHGDHIGGLLDAQGQPRFPNATVHLHALERDFWADPARAAAAPESQRSGFQAARTVLTGLGDRVRTFTAQTEIAPGLTAEPVVGHTPGHTVYRLISGGSQMVFLGDMIHSVAIQSPRPEVTVEFDNDQTQARQARLDFLRANAREGVLFAGPHFPAPGVARFTPAGEGYTYQAVAAQ